MWPPSDGAMHAMRWTLIMMQTRTLTNISTVRIYTQPTCMQTSDTKIQFIVNWQGLTSVQTLARAGKYSDISSPGPWLSVLVNNDSKHFLYLPLES